jgi:hypothetical protein
MGTGFLRKAMSASDSSRCGLSTKSVVCRLLALISSSAEDTIPATATSRLVVVSRHIFYILLSIGICNCQSTELTEGALSRPPQTRKLKMVSQFKINLLIDYTYR